MIRLVWSQLVRRGSRSVALVLGLLLACAGFAVLTSQTRQSTLQVKTTVAVNARSAYDILVRPKGAVLPSERAQGLVQAGFLSGIHGGITLGQWHRIERQSDVSVAAPVAVVGYVMPKIFVPVDISEAVNGSSGRVLIRGDTVWRTDNGASAEPARPSFDYVTPRQVDSSFDATSGIESATEIGADGRSHTVCRYDTAKPPWTVQDPPTSASCLSRSRYRQLSKDPASQGPSDPVFPFPFLVEAIDPGAEARLAGVKGAVVAGRYLTPGKPNTRSTSVGVAQQVPVIVASRPATHLSVSYTLRQLPTAAADAVSNGKGVESQLQTPGRVIASGRIDQDQAYRRLLGAMATPTSRGDYFARQLSYLYTTGPTGYAVAANAGVLRARTVHNRRDVWADPAGGDMSGSLIPAGGDDTAFRSLRGYQFNTANAEQLTPPAFVKMGVFDAAKLPGYSALSQVPLGTYASTQVTGASAHDRKVLGNKPLAPSSNIAGYPQPAPLMLTTLDALPAFQNAGDWFALPGDPGGHSFRAPLSASAPISSIRVRVKGVTGVDPVSRERVRLAAQEIGQATGLLVDITVGSSPTPRTISLPAGQHGRPQLTLTENWVHKGAAIAILTAVDKKSLALFALVLVVCALFVTNSVGASVRARRSELGVLACLGWPRSWLLRMVLGELAAIAVAAGIGGAILARGAGAALGIPITNSRALLALPAALLVALLAGAIPAWQAAKAPPMEAVRPSAHLPAKAREPRSVTALAWANVTRNRARSLLAAAGLGTAAAALTVIVGVLYAFRGAVVGTLLGSAVTVQVHGADYAAVAAIVLLAGAGVANVLFLNIRERGTEIATLRALGWTEPTLTRLLLTEGLAIGIIGALIGAAAGAAVIMLVLGASASSAALPAAAAFGVGVAVAGIATLPPLLALHRLPTALLLTEN